MLHATTTPYHYQRTNATRLSTAKLGLLLMDMGTGKTLTSLLALDMLRTRLQRELSVLVLVPKAIEMNFANEIKTHTQFTHHFVTGRSQPRTDCINILPFSLLQSKSMNLEFDINFDVIIVDEAHTFRNRNTISYRRAKEICQSTDYLWLLTGTPIVNRKSDLNSLYSLKSMADPEHIVTSKADVLDLPQVIYTKHIVERDYNIKERISPYPLAQITYDRMASCHNINKWKVLKQLAQDNDCVVFATYKETVLGLMDYLDTSLSIHGDMEMSERYRHIDRFQNEGGVIVCTYATAGVGINLTRANKIFFLDPAWNPATTNQAIDRVHRIGLKHDVTVHFLIQDEKCDPWMYDIIANKQSIITITMGTEERLPFTPEVVVERPKRKIGTRPMSKPMTTIPKPVRIA